MAQPGKNVRPKTTASPATAASETFDTLLVAVGKDRDREAFIRLFEYFAPRIKSFLMKGGLRPAQADELAQETLLTVWNKAPGYDPAKAAASTWIFTIARNKRIDTFRRHRPEAPELSQPDSDATWAGNPPNASPYDAMARAQQDAAIRAAMDTLPPEQGALIRKSFFEDKAHSEIARETGVPLGTVKSRIRLALGHLRKNLKNLEREAP